MNSQADSVEGAQSFEENPTSSGRRLTQLDRLSVTELTGIGPARAKALGAMSIVSVLDLLMHYPRRYADRSHPTLINDAVVGEESMIEAKVTSIRSRPARNRRSIVDVEIADESGVLTVTFFNQPYRKDQLHEQDDVVVFGKVELFRSKLQMTNPIVDLVGDQTGAIIPIYPQSAKAGVSSRDLTRYVTEALSRAKVFADPLPEIVRKQLKLVNRSAAFLHIHRPESMNEVFPARRRLAFDELWRMQLVLVLRKRAQAREARGIAHRTVANDPSTDLVGAFTSRLSFALTGAQRRALDEITADLASELPMHRLLQGDVGSGKTIVALITLLYGVQGGHQGALMVPTEVLAGQHFGVAKRLLAGIMVPDSRCLTGEREVRIELLTSQTSTTRRSELHQGLRDGTVDVVVGTHALLTDEVRFHSLGIVVIDEQHRFGVDQRAILREKGSGTGNDRRDPDLLVMTATPIPRTAAMTVYGDLDYSELDELPPGRTPIRTRWVSEPSDEQRVWSRVREEVTKGAQVFVVCPRVRAQDDLDESDQSGLIYLDDRGDEQPKLFGLDETATPTRPARSAIEEAERLATTELVGLRVGLLHGQMPSNEKESVMVSFRDGFLDVLVATTVIEVGVDVPRATVMIIEDADRFGIAQLHQLRGRVGRGAGESVCYLLGYDVSEEAGKRLAAVAGTTNGFELAEIDLELRGEGTVLGARQKGRNDLRLASLRRDRELVLLARSVASQMIDADPTLANSHAILNELLLFIGEDEALYLERS